MRSFVHLSLRGQLDVFVEVFGVIQKIIGLYSFISDFEIISTSVQLFCQNRLSLTGQSRKLIFLYLLTYRFEANFLFFYAPFAEIINELVSVIQILGILFRFISIALQFPPHILVDDI